MVQSLLALTNITTPAMNVAMPNVYVYCICILRAASVYVYICVCLYLNVFAIYGVMWLPELVISESTAVRVQVH